MWRDIGREGEHFVSKLRSILTSSLGKDKQQQIFTACLPCREWLSVVLCTSHSNVFRTATTTSNLIDIVSWVFTFRKHGMTKQMLKLSVLVIWCSWGTTVITAHSL